MHRVTWPRVGLVIVVLASSLVAALTVNEARHAGAAAGTVQRITSGELAQNGGFESGPSPWQEMPNSNFAIYANGQIGPNDTAYAGDYYGATNTSASGGGIFENITGLNIITGENICGNAELRSELNETGATGAFVIWLLGGSTPEYGSVTYTGLGNGTSWEQFSTCVTATGDYSMVRIQFYPNANSPTVDIDAVDVHDAMSLPQNDVVNGGFASGTAPWQELPDSNYAVYSNSQSAPGDQAYAGNNYGATNTTTTGGGISQNINDVNISAGDTFCGSAELRTEGDVTGANGQLTVSLTGGGQTASGVAYYSNLGDGTEWALSTACVTATTTYSTVQIQVNPAANSPTLDIDAVDVTEYLDMQQSLAQNGSFEMGESPWLAMPSSNFALYANGQLALDDTAYDGNYYAATNTSASGGGIYEDVSGVTIDPGETYCASAELRNEGDETGAAGVFTIWLLGGSSAEYGNSAYSNLGNVGDWTQYITCATATVAHTDVRIQFYPDPNMPTVDIDAVSAGYVSGSVPNPNCTPNDSCTPQTFADTLLSQPGIGAPITTSNEYALETWELAEGGGAGCPGQPPNESPWANSGGPAGNPLNTTQTEPGSTDWNDVGVQIFASGDGETCWYWGVLATEQTLNGSIGNYGPIIAVLQDPVFNSYDQCVRLATAVGQSEWGTGEFFSRLLRGPR